MGLTTAETITQAELAALQSAVRKLWRLWPGPRGREVLLNRDEFAQVLACLPPIVENE